MKSLLNNSINSDQAIMEKIGQIRVKCFKIPGNASNSALIESIKTVVYYFSQIDFYPFINQFWKVLSFEEKEKAEAFYFVNDHKNYIVCHGLLRFILSEKMAADPENLIFIKGLNDKPYLEGNGPAFNLSHTKELCAIAISNGQEVGVDIEKIKENRDFQDICASFFSEEEQFRINYSDKPLEDFYLLWTRKEAFLKATGLGLNTSLKDINVCNETNIIDRTRLCQYRDVETQRRYFIYSGQIENHLISLALPNETSVGLVALTPEYLSLITSEFGEYAKS
jgi:phosphopantetheine--protein transferase-like protein